MEGLAEGDYEIQWQAAICTFWTDQAGPQPTLTTLPLPAGTVDPPFTAPPGFGIVHMTLGYQGLAALFAETRPAPLLTLGEIAIRVRSEGDRPAAAVPPRAPLRPVASTAQFPSTRGSDATPPDQPSPVAPPSQTQPAQVVSPPLSAAEVRPTVPPSQPPEPTPASPQQGVGSSCLPPTAVHFATSGSSTTSLSLAVPERLLIGTRSNGELVHWHFGHPQLPNRHLLIFGASGSGKTYGIQCLLAEMAQQGLRSLIIDYTDGFLPQQMDPRFAEAAAPKSHYVVTERLPLNPFRRQQQVIDPSLPPLEEKPYQVATRIESIFASIFELGDQQSAALIRAIESGIEAQP